MSAPPPRMHLGLWLLTCGHHIAACAIPTPTPASVLRLDHYADAARIAERGRFDMVFFEDTLRRASATARCSARRRSIPSIPWSRSPPWCP